MLVTNLVNVRYLTGFTGSNGALLVRADGGDVLATDGRYTTQAGAAGARRRAAGRPDDGAGAGRAGRCGAAPGGSASRPTT